VDDALAATIVMGDRLSDEAHAVVHRLRRGGAPGADRRRGDPRRAASVTGPASAPLVLADARRVGLLAAELVANRVRARPSLRVLLPTGRTPLPMYAALRAHAADGSLPTGHVAVLGLDEYLGLAGDDPRSFRATLDREIAGLPLGRREALDGAAPDAAVEAARYQAVLDAAPIDLAVLGLGRDGHVAFDEPGSLPAEGVHRVALTATTIADAADGFGGPANVPREALTVGLRSLLSAREVLLLVTGADKAEALRATLCDPPGPAVPATLLRGHPRLTILCDRDAAGLLPTRPGRDSEHVVIVLGHREPGISAEHRISAHSRARLGRAARICAREAARAVILTGYTHTGGLSEAEQMALEWPRQEVPVILEVAGRNTAENASRSLPLVLAQGGVRRVSVVTSVWHIRTPYFFAPYRAHGLEVRFRPAPPLRGWAHLLAEEAGGLAGMRVQRAAAMAAVRLPPAA
jgi:glucosamine-6-phosphate deaminase